MKIKTENGDLIDALNWWPGKIAVVFGEYYYAIVSLEQ